MSTSTLHPRTSTGESPSGLPSPQELLAPIFERASQSSSLLSSKHPATLRGEALEIPKFLLLGQRGGGKPIRLAIFAGLDAGAIETTAALARLLLQYELSPALARDFALFAYPLVNPLGFATPPAPLSDFEHRYANDRLDADVQYYKGELRQWTFNGILTLRTDPRATGFYAKVRSEVIGYDVAQPAIETLGKTLPLRANPVTVRPDDRFARLADHAYGKLLAPTNQAPLPFEIDAFAPASIPIEQRITGLFLFVQETLRHYRALISHAADL